MQKQAAETFLFDAVVFPMGPFVTLIKYFSCKQKKLNK